ncbi:MAG TPA: response regulator [Anaerolineae bacterium]|nr:response regulator [Anaerolineae bacterium]
MVTSRMPPSSATILLVEDTQSIIDGLCELLELAAITPNLQLLTANNGVEGLEALEDAKTLPDLIISDIMMPEMDGFEFLSRVRANHEWVHIPFIFLTAKGTDQDIKIGRLSGAERYITKPFASAELIELVKDQLARSHARQQVYQTNLDQLKQNIIQTLNHEFRTPLTHVTAYYEMLADSLINYNQNEDPQAYLRGLQKGCIRLNQLLDDLVTLVELRTDDAAREFEAMAEPIYNVVRLLIKVAEAREKEAEEQGISLFIDLPMTSPPVFGYDTKLKDAFERIVDNAIKFIDLEKAGEKAVYLTMEEKDNQLHFHIRDTGIGIPRHIQSELFDAFTQHNRDRLEQQGAGSGLAIAQGWVNLHHGHINLVSQENEGSTFTVILPIGTTPTHNTNATKSEHTIKKASILIVEDDPFLLNGLSELLELEEDEFSFQVFTATDGVEGLKRMQEHRPDIIISDIMMPNMDGYTFMKTVRQNPDWMAIPFILVTARNQKKERFRGLSSGAEEYITKPYDSLELIKMVKAQLNRYYQRNSSTIAGFRQFKESILSLLKPDDMLAPLSSVTKYTQELDRNLNNARTGDALKQSLQGIQNGSRTLTHFVEDFITLIDLKTGIESSFIEDPYLIDNPALILLELQQILHFDPESPYTLAYQYEAVNAAILCRQSLLTNALERLIKATYLLLPKPKPDTINIQIQHDDRFIYFVIYGEGLGLPTPVAQKLKQLFTQKDKAANTQLSFLEYGPTFSIAHEYIKMHNGTISLDNNFESGFRYVIKLPLA